MRETPPPAEWDSLETATAAIAGSWELLGTPVQVDASLDWSQRVGRPLQSFHLQYHEQLRALAWHYDRTGDARALATIESVVMRWIASTARGGGDAWHPYPISVRVFAWTDVLALVGNRFSAGVRDAMLASLASQLDVLARRRERQIDANHLQRNDAALAVGGIVFTGRASARWRRVGLDGTWRALQNHVLDDGMHYERSPMYHAGMLGDVLRVIDCCHAAGADVPDAALRRVASMVRALQLLTRSDQSLHQFNDTAALIAPPTAWLAERAARSIGHAVATTVPTDGAWLLPQGGYAGWRDPGAGVQIAFDAGAAGPRQQPGHAQCDALSFELCLDHRPVIVNAGVHGYDHDPYREYSRSTRGHSTVQIGAFEQHEMWATFRVARFGAVRGPIIESDRPWAVSGEVQAYLDGRHQRRLELMAPNCLRITDTVAGPSGEIARSRLILHPDFTAVAEGNVVIATRGTLELKIEAAEGAMVQIRHSSMSPVEGWYFPTFGSACATTTVVSERRLPSPPIVTTLRWRQR